MTSSKIFGEISCIFYAISLLNYLTHAPFLSKHYRPMLGNHHTIASNDLHSSSDSKKTIRRRCSLINWIFRRGPDYVRLDTPAPNTGYFGKALMDIGEDDELSAPVLVTIVLLFSSVARLLPENITL